MISLTVTAHTETGSCTVRWGVAEFQLAHALVAVLLYEEKEGPVSVTRQESGTQTLEIKSTRLLDLELTSELPEGATHYTYRFWDIGGKYPDAFPALLVGAAAFVIRRPELAADSSVLEAARELLNL